jgi:hypothetical protein
VGEGSGTGNWSQDVTACPDFLLILPTCTSGDNGITALYTEFCGSSGIYNPQTNHCLPVEYVGVTDTCGSSTLDSRKKRNWLHHR